MSKKERSMCYWKMTERYIVQKKKQISYVRKWKKKKKIVCQVRKKIGTKKIKSIDLVSNRIKKNCQW